MKNKKLKKWPLILAIALNTIVPLITAIYNTLSLGSAFGINYNNIAHWNLSQEQYGILFGLFAWLVVFIWLAGFSARTNRELIYISSQYKYFWCKKITKRNWASLKNTVLNGRYPLNWPKKSRLPKGDRSLDLIGKSALWSVDYIGAAILTIKLFIPVDANVGIIICCLIAVWVVWIGAQILTDILSQNIYQEWLKQILVDLDTKFGNSRFNPTYPNI